MRDTRRASVSARLLVLAALLAPQPAHAVDGVPPERPAERRWETWGGQGGIESFDPPAWRKQQHVVPLFRTWIAPTFGHSASGGGSLLGGSLAIGWESQHAVAPALNRWFFGSTFGLEARAHALRAREGAPRAFLAGGGLALTMTVTEHRFTGLERVRFPSVFGLMLPEVGLAARRPQAAALYTRWSAPIAVLIEKHVAVELVPAVSLFYAGSSGAEALWQLGIALSWRQMGTPMRLALR